MIFGFLGKKRSGKSTACDYIKDKRPLATKLNFKDALIKEVEQNFPKLIQEIIAVYDRIEYDGMNPWTFERLVKEKPPLFRALLQNYGTDVRRRDHEDYWVVKWLQNAKYIQGDIVVDDVRFHNEAEAVKSMGGTLTRIERLDLQSSDTHISESEMDTIPPDYTITVGTGEFAKLHLELDKILESSPTIKYASDEE